MPHGYVFLNAICLAAGFNIIAKPEKPVYYTNDNHFGQTIIPYKVGVLVATSFPESQKLHYCTLENECEEVKITGVVAKGFKPIVSAAKSPDGEQFVFCRQIRSRKSVNEYLNGLCTVTSRHMSKVRDISPADLVVSQINSNSNNSNLLSSEQRDSVQAALQPIGGENSNNNNNNDNVEDDEDDEDDGTEIAFVLDGSGSIEPEDFDRAKTFISSMMSKIWDSCFDCNFAIVQYGNLIRDELSLMENVDGQRALEKVKNIQQIKKYTITASAIHYVLEHVFVPENGSKLEAKKIIVVLTDGEIQGDTRNLADVLNSPKLHNVLRFAIGVGDVFNKTAAMNELKDIASEPYDKHLFMVDNYAALDGYLEKLERSITGIEGIQQGTGFHFSLSEAGFSSHYAHDGALLFGAVGAYDWSGGLILTTSRGDNVNFLNGTSSEQRFSYLGYSVTSARRSGGDLYISGAPRNNLSGAVLVFTSDSHQLRQTLFGDQVGSYFGAELCALDTDRDEKTDYLLVGAPFFHQKAEEGKVYLYRLDQNGVFHRENWAWQGSTEHPFSRFGSAVANIGDIDRNGFNDVAVGAPGEGDYPHGSFGSVYIYNGDQGGIKRQYSQRISATDFGMKLTFFGQAVSGLPESIAVGCKEGLTFLRTVPVIVFQPEITFEPPVIPLAYHNRGVLTNRPITLKICFNTQRGGIKSGRLPILYQLDLDTRHVEKRLSFENGPSMMGYFNFTDDIQCLEKINLKFMGCYDCISPIEVKLNFTLSNEDGEPQVRIMDKYSPTELTTQLPFQMDCVQTCVPEFTLSDSKLSKEMIVVGATQDLSLDFNLNNRGDNSFLTKLIVEYPNILYFNRVSKRIGDTVCGDDVRPYTSVLRCNISHPTLKSMHQANFSIYWKLHPEKPKSRTAQIRAILTSENEGRKVIDNRTYSFSVKSALQVQLIGQAEPQRLDVRENTEAKENLKFQFDIHNKNKHNAELTVDINITLYTRATKLTIKKISQGSCTESGNFLGTGTYSVQCKVRNQHETIQIESEVTISAVQGNSENITARATLSFDRDQYETEGVLSYNLVEVLVKRQAVVQSSAAIAGGVIGGCLLLLIIIITLVKCGFFRRRHQKPSEGQTNNPP